MVSERVGVFGCMRVHVRMLKGTCAHGCEGSGSLSCLKLCVSYSGCV